MIIIPFITVLVIHYSVNVKEKLKNAKSYFIKDHYFVAKIEIHEPII